MSIKWRCLLWEFYYNLYVHISKQVSLKLLFLNLVSFFLPGTVEIKCPLCAENIGSINAYIDHQHLKHYTERETMKFVCCLCSYSSVAKDHLRKHLMRHYDIKPFSCQKCGTTFTTKHQLTRHHINNHLNLKFRR